jgi:hypothetical protein
MFEMLRDKDATVAGNCVGVLNEVLASADRTTGLELLNKNVVIYLLTRFRLGVLLCVGL